MTLYLDSSALVKLAVDEQESAALRGFIGPRPEQVSSALTTVELLRAVAGRGPEAVVAARDTLGNLALLAITDDVLEDAATLSVEPFLRGLDAIHLATARQLGAELTAVVTYDRRMVDAARALRIPVESPQ